MGEVGMWNVTSVADSAFFPHHKGFLKFTVIKLWGGIFMGNLFWSGRVVIVVTCAAVFLLCVLFIRQRENRNSTEDGIWRNFVLSWLIKTDVDAKSKATVKLYVVTQEDALRPYILVY